MRTIRRTLVAVAAALSLSTFAAVAVAGPKDDPMKTFKNAVALFDQKQFEYALPLFKEVHDALQSPNASMYIGRCLRALDRLPEAYDAFSLAVQEATEKATKDPKYEATRDVAAGERSAVEASIARIVLVLPDPPEGVALTLDGKPIPREQFGATLARPPGTFQVDATAPGRKPFHESLSIHGGSIAQVTVALLLPSAAVASGGGGGGDGGPQPPPTGSSGIVRTAGYAVTGLGVAGGAVFAIFGIMSNSKFDSLANACNHAPNCKDPTAHDTASSGRTLDLVADIGLGVGIAGIGAGVPMILFGGAKPPPAAQGFSVHASPSLAGLSYGGSF